MSSFQQTSEPVIKDHPQKAVRQINPPQHAPYIHQNVSPSIPQSLLMQSQNDNVLRRRLAAATLRQNQSTGLDIPQQKHMLGYQQHNAQQQLHGHNINTSGPYNVQMSQRSIISTQQQSIERQLNSSQVEKMQRQRIEQQTHQMTGMPASTLLREGEVCRKVQMLKSKYVRELTVIFQRLKYRLQNQDRLNIQKLEVLKSLYQKVENILNMLNMAESNITPTSEELLGLLENKIRYIIQRCRHQQPGSSLENEKLSTDVHATRQLVKLGSQTSQTQTNQDVKKPPPQSVNMECFATEMQHINVTNLMNYSETPILQHGIKHMQTNLTKKDSDQTSSSRYLRIPTSGTPPQQYVKDYIHGPQSNDNTFDSRFSVPKDVHLRQLSVQAQKPEQQLLKQNDRPVKLQSEAFPNPSPEYHKSSGQQVPKHTSQGEDNNLPIQLTEARTPLNSITSPSRISSLAPKNSSLLPVDSGKPKSDIPPHSNAGNIGDEQVKGVPEAPLISTSLLEKSIDDVHCNNLTVDSDEVQPIQKLLKVVNSMSYKALGASAEDIASVVCMTDRMKRQRSTLAIIDDASESRICGMMKRPRLELEVNQTLLEEIRAINRRLIDTVLDICDQENVPSVKEGEGTIVRCSFGGVASSPSLMSSPMFPLQPLRLLVPPNYPFCSPIFLDKLTVQVENELEDPSAKVMSKLSRSLRTLAEPFSLGDIARIWDTYARAVVCEYAQHNGGGTFSSKYGTWEDCLNVA